MEVNYQIKSAESFELLKPVAEIAAREDYAVCRRIMRSASKNYSAASNYLPADKLPHVEALYALMRVGDDRVDVTHRGFASAQAAINDWEHAYWSAFETGASSHPVLRAYLNTARTFGIPGEVMTPYFRAMREDLTIHRFPTFNHLLHYMDGSAIPVGRAMTYILGARYPYSIEQALPGADALSIAMQLSNFWRDIGEDWRIGRIYIPLEDMHLFGYEPSDLGTGRIDERIVSLLEYEFERTEAYYQKARHSVQMLAVGRWAVMSALEIYRAILNDIRTHRYDVFSRRAGASPLRKLGLAVSAYFQLAQSSQPDISTAQPE